MGCEDKLWLVWVKMATGYFQGFLLVLLFYSNLIGIKYGLHFSNHLKIKMLFDKEPIYWKKYINKKIIFRPKYGQNLIHKCGSQCDGNNS